MLNKTASFGTAGTGLVSYGKASTNTKPKFQQSKTVTQSDPTESYQTSVPMKTLLASDTKAKPESVTESKVVEKKTPASASMQSMLDDIANPTSHFKVSVGQGGLLTMVNQEDVLSSIAEEKTKEAKAMKPENPWTPLLLHLDPSRSGRIEFPRPSKAEES